MKVRKEFENQEDQEEYVQKRIQYKEFVRSMTKFLMTTRFTSSTWEENVVCRSNYPKLGCIYGVPEKIRTSIPVDSIMFVLEMNNTLNKIMGIGMVKNHPICGKYRIYKNGNYNRFVYIGKYRIDRSEMTEKEEQIMKAFDILCFKGATHQKRSQGMKCYPFHMLFECKKIIDLVDFVSNMFKTRIVNNIVNNE